MIPTAKTPTTVTATYLDGKQAEWLESVRPQSPRRSGYIA